MDAKQRIEYLYSFYNTNGNQIEELVKQADPKSKFSRQSLTNIRNGTTKSITLKLAAEILKAYPDINIMWLTSGKGSMLKNDDPETYPPIEDQLIKVVNKNKKPQDTVTPLSNDNYMMVEYQDLATAAGTMGGETIESLPDTKRRLVPREYDNGNFLVVRVDGDSMDDGSKYSIPNGTEILIKEFNLDNGDTLPIRNNLFVIVSRDGTALKQIIEHKPGEYIICHSYNSKFKDYTVLMEDVIQIFIYRKIVSSRPEIPDIN